MYDEKFSNIYNEYGWDYFSLSMGNAILDYFKENSIFLNKHLDLCCGTGVLCDLFYNNGIDTTGVDISEFMIEIARKKNSNINFYVADVLGYDNSKKYDLVTLTCDAVNHFLGNNDLEKLFVNAYNLLESNGYLIFDVLDRSKIEFEKEIVSNRDDGIKVYYYITDRDDLINTNVRIKQDDNFVYEKDILEKMYDLASIESNLNKCGFEIVKCGDRIMNEKQRFKDKVYIIAKKKI